ncbi:hypothetical protein B0H11DRAFT_1807928 [Mycena galericulata]|nr:hypothetical protein B0H11DRAFT_1807928 [Mycena galericulata]
MYLQPTHPFQKHFHTRISRHISNIPLSWQISSSSPSRTFNELTALNITIQALDPASFFGFDLPDPQTDPAVLAHPVLVNNLKRPAGAISKEDRLFFRYLEHAIRGFPTGPATESDVDDFAAFLLQMLDYDEPEGVVHQRWEIGFIMCGQRVSAKLDMVIMNDEDYILLVQRHMLPVEAEPQLIAEAIAAQYENNQRRRTLGLATVPTRVFAGIVMTGTAPTFYKIPVSESLVHATYNPLYLYPQHTTVVSKFVPPVPNLSEYMSDGMMPLDNRQIVFQCLAAFKQFMV